MLLNGTTLITLLPTIKGLLNSTVLSIIYSEKREITVSLSSQENVSKDMRFEKTVICRGKKEKFEQRKVGTKKACVLLQRVSSPI